MSIRTFGIIVLNVESKHPKIREQIKSFCYNPLSDVSLFGWFESEVADGFKIMLGHCRRGMNAGMFLFISNGHY
jgi:hypothetical protein